MDERLTELRRLKGTGQHLGVIRLARAILEAPETVTDAEGVEVARSGITACMATENYVVANWFANEQETWAIGAGDRRLMAIAAYHMGTVKLNLGDAPAALHAFVQFREALEFGVEGLDRYDGPARFNHGSALMYYRKYQEAVSQFMAAREAWKAAGNPYGMIQADLETAWALLLDGRTEGSGHYLERAGELLADHEDAGLQATMLCHQALYHHRLREYHEAIRLCREVLETGRQGVTPYHRSEAAWISGECALDQGQIPEAAALAEIALAHAIESNAPLLMNRGSDLRRRIREAREQTA